MANISNSIGLLQVIMDCWNNSDVKTIDFIARGPCGWTSFHTACRFATLTFVEKVLTHLISKEVNIFEFTHDEEDIFHMAVSNSDSRVPKYIFEQFKENFHNYKNSFGQSVMHLAIMNGKRRTVDYLLASRKKLNIKINEITNGENLVHIACKYKRIDVLKNLLNCLKQDKCEAYMNAQNDHGLTPLHYACYFGNLITVKYMLKLKADPTATSHNKETILHFAALNPNQNILKYLLIKYPELVERTTDTNLSILHILCSKGHLGNIKRLFRCPNLRFFDTLETQRGWTPLHWASYNGHDKVVKFMLGQFKNKSINVQAKTKAGQTAQQLAMAQGHIEVVKLFEM